VFGEALALRDRPPDGARSRVHLASLPMEDPAENAIMVNALQRHATVVVQKSLGEGFVSPSPRPCGSKRARERVRHEFTSPRSLMDYVRVIRLLERSDVLAAA
jgi:hypothetical protein